MPTFVLHALGKSTKKVSLQKPSIKVGRDPDNDLVLGDSTVSRQHATFKMDAAGRWYVSCLSETNPIVVNGAQVTKRKYVHEGSEILIGKESLVIFSSNDKSAQAYLNQTDAMIKAECRTCQWAGLVRAGHKKASCPDCGSTDMVVANAYAKADEIERAKEGATALMSPGAVGDFLKRLKVAKRSRIERTDGREPTTRPLSEDTPLLLSRAKDAPLRLFGFTLGGSVVIEWEGTHFVVTSTVFFPAMRVNGEKTRSSALKHNDRIVVGQNQFRFLTD
jgi:Zn finger protein HypA/HybF involved in hydrogenase expression